MRILDKELAKISEAYQKYGPSWKNPSICSHQDIGKSSDYTCYKCGRRITTDENGVKSYFLADGYRYMTKIPKSLKFVKEKGEIFIIKSCEKLFYHKEKDRVTARTQIRCNPLTLCPDCVRTKKEEVLR